MANAKTKNVGMDMTTMNLGPRDIAEFLVTAYKADQPVFMWGPPGIGKSAIIQSVAKRLEVGLIDFRALMRDVVDLNGIPSASSDGNYTKWLRPNFLPEEGKGIFFLDELNAAPPSMQAVCYQIVHDRQAGEHKLAKGWLPIAAGNYDTDGAVTSRMPTPLKSRFTHLNIRVEKDKDDDGTFHLENQGQWAEAWITWGRENGIDSNVIAFHRFTEGSDLYAFNKAAQTFPCPRTWEFVSKILKTDPSQKMLMPLIAGTIGLGHAAKFYAFIQDAKSLPDIEEVLKNPTKVAIPEQGGKKYALLCALASHLAKLEGKEFKTGFEQGIQFIERLDSEFQAMVVMDIYDLKKDEVKVLKAFREWVCGPVGALLESVRYMDR